MDAITALAHLERFRRTWAEAPKDEVLDTIINGDKRAQSIYFEILHYQVEIHVMIGARFGLQEWCTIVDTRPKKAEVDHLALSSYESLSSGIRTFLDISHRIVDAKCRKDRAELEEAVRAWLMEELAEFRKDPNEFVLRVGSHVAEYEPSVSVHTVRYALTRT